MWHYKHSNTDHIRKATNGINWERSFTNKDANEKVNIFNEISSNFLNDYIAYETIICDDQDSPRINNSKSQKSDIREKPAFSRVKPNINDGTVLKKLQCLQYKLGGLIDTTKR